MKKLNVKGFTLVIVLFTIVLFSVIGLSLFAITGSNTKQVGKTSTELAAIDVAEMGVIYFESILTEHYYIEIKKIINNIELDYYNEYKAKVDAAGEDEEVEFIPLPIDLLAEKLYETPLPPIPPGTYETTKTVDSDIQFSIYDIEYFTFGSDKIAQFKSKSSLEDGKEVSLEGIIIIELDDFLADFIAKVPTTSPFTTSPPLEIVTPPEISNIISKCPDGSCDSSVCEVHSTKIDDFKACKQKDIYLDEKIDLQNNQKFTMSNLNVYVDSSLNLPNTGFINSNVFIDGSLFVGNNLVDDIFNSWVRVNGDVTITNNLTHNITNSAMIVFGNFDLMKNFNGNITNSLICAKEFNGNWRDYAAPDKLTNMSIDGETLKCIDYRSDGSGSDDGSHISPTPTPATLEREVEVIY